MRSFSHVLIAAGLAKSKQLSRQNQLLFAAGSLLPDLPLIVLSSSVFLKTKSIAETHKIMHWQFENNRLWIIAHNSPHSLAILIPLLALAWFYRRKLTSEWLIWLSLGAILHTIIDIFTHFSDGPRFLFPFNWSYRFQSPVSYWDPNHFGQYFRLFEYSLDIGIVLFLLSPILKRPFYSKFFKLYKSFTKTLFQ